MTIFLILSLPLVLALGGFHSRLRPRVTSYAPWLAVPPLALALWNPPHATLETSWLFIGIHLGFDDIGRIFVIGGALLWTLTGFAARALFARDSNSHRLFIMYLVTLTGTLGLFMAQDLPTFTLFYAFMTFSAYGLIIFTPTAAAQRAGRTYLILAVIGEFLLLEAILLITFNTTNASFTEIPGAVMTAPEDNLIIGLLLIGFGIKIGVVPLHMWVPLAYSATPAPISALLNGSMVMAGFLGWIRLLPLGEMSFPGWGLVCLIAGTITLFYGVIVGITQHHPHTILAYASISQAGLMLASLGMSMMTPEAWPQIYPLLVLSALHHALVIGVLFLGVSVAGQATGSFRQGRWVSLGLVVPALALAGSPYSSGTLVPAIFEATAPFSPWTAPLIWLPSLGAFGMTLVMGRFLIETWPVTHGKTEREATKHMSPGVWLPWGVLLICGGLLAWVVRWQITVDTGGLVWSPMAIWAGLWPILAGVLLAWITASKSQRLPAVRIPPGDLVVGIEGLTHQIQKRWDRITGEAWQKRRSDLVSHPILHHSRTRAVSIIEKMEARLGQWQTLGTVFLFLAVILFTVLNAP
jgi:formate hydrogenlyase subunit 3/multisubunit Na+/H+ antiporter MnhD subunit